MQMNFEKRKDTERRGAEYRITIGSYFQDITHEEAEALFDQMCDKLESRCHRKSGVADKEQCS